MNILEIKNLSKRFGEIQAVNDISFSVKKGELFAFLGINGAGKSTTISMVCGRLTPDSGEIFIDGEKQKADDLSLKKKIGVVFQSSVLDKTLTVYDNLSLRAALYGITGEAFKKRLEELDELLGVKEILKRPVGKLSGGQRRRADIARALLHAPKILILDEPTTGLDPQTRKTVWNAVDKMRKQNALTVLLTTHYMEEAMDADNVVIIDRGLLVAEGTPVELKNRYTGDFITVYGKRKDEIEKLSLPYEEGNGFYRIQVKDTAEATRLIVKYPDFFTDYEVEKGKMDDVFLAVTGKKAGGEE